MWKDIIGFEKIYEINEFGDVRDYKTKKLKHVYINNKGYKMIDLQKDNVRVRMLVHRLVAIHFVPNPNNYPIVLHKDNNKTNTYYTNLEWGTYSENNSQSIRDGLNFVPRPDNRKYYELYNDTETILCHGAEDIINNIGYGTESTIRNMLHRNTTIRCGKFEGFKVRRNYNITCPIYFDKSLIDRRSTISP